MGRAIGIDLGTSNSCVAYVENGRPKVIPDSEGNRTTPSVYAIDALQQAIVGHPAKAQAGTNRLNTIFGIKRLIGRKYASPEVQKAASQLPYNIIPSDNGDAWVEINGVPTSAEEVSAQVLRKMKEVAEEFFGERVVQAVITVPAHFNDSQRQATKDAGKLAGLDVMRIINEPTAAALAFGLDQLDEEEKSRKQKSAYVNRAQVDRVIAVFDLGGGTFDISILELSGGIFEVRATNGDTFLGGEDYDMAIAKYLLDQFKEKTGMDISADRGVLHRFNQAAKDAKHQLSDLPKVEVDLPFVRGMEHFKLTLDRKTIEDIVMPSLMKMEGPCLEALEDAGLVPEDITDVILVGGMTRMPAVKKAARKIFGKDPQDCVDPDEAVALGAAVQAGLLQGLVKGVSFLDVTSLTLGIEIQGGRTHPLIHKNTAVPASVTEIFTTSAPNQPQVSVHVLQGESDYAPDNKSLARFELMGVRPAPRGVPEIAVTFEVDADGIMHVSAKDLDTGQQQRVEIIASSGLSDYEIDRMLRERQIEDEQRARQNQRIIGDLKMEEDNSNGNGDELAQIKRELKSLIFVIQARLNTEGLAFKGRGRALLDDSLSSARLLLDRGPSADELKQCIQEISQRSEALEDYLETIW